MASDNEPAKLLLPYLQRADELQKHEPLVAYYCRLYAMERGLKIPQSNRTKTTSALLVSILNQLEKDKKSLKLSPDDNLHVEGFALNVFAKADKQDRAGKADLNTAKTFYAASIFFEILNQFGELQPDIEQKQKYAVWKAADIRKALKEGRKPIPGPPGGDKDQSVLSNASSGEYDLDSGRSDAEPRASDLTTSPRSEPPSRTASDSDSFLQMHNHDDNKFQTSPTITQPHYPTETYIPQSQNHLFQSYPSHDVPSHSYPNFQSYPNFSDSNLPSAPSHYPSYHQGSDASCTNLSPSNTNAYASNSQHNFSGTNGNGSITEHSSHDTKKYEYDSSYQPPPGKLAEAQKAARFAVGALAFDDVFVAVDHLKKALDLLTNPSAGD